MNRSEYRIFAEYSGESVFVRADVVHNEAAENLVRQAVRRIGRLDTSFNNAGMPRNKDHILDLTDAGRIALYRPTSRRSSDESAVYTSWRCHSSRRSSNRPAGSEPAHSKRRAIIAWRNAKGFLVAAAEMAEIGEPARERDLRDAVACVQRVGQVSPAFFQTSHPNPFADRALIGVKQVLKIAWGNAYKAGNLFGIERVVVQEAVDERLGAEDQGGPRG